MPVFATYRLGLPDVYEVRKELVRCNIKNIETDINSYLRDAQKVFCNIWMDLSQSTWVVRQILKSTEHPCLREMQFNVGFYENKVLFKLQVNDKYVKYFTPVNSPH